MGLGAIGPYVGTMILNRATPGAGTPITHNFGALRLSLNYGAPNALHVLAGPNAPTGGVLDGCILTQSMLPLPAQAGRGAGCGDLSR